jgi:hypothetical protein
MPTMTAEQVAGIVELIGPPIPSTTAQWVAKARQESSFNTDAVNGVHIGLWQIDYTLHAGKAGTSKNKDTFRQQLFSGAVNFKVAKVLFGESGWKPWNASGGAPVPTDADKKAGENPDDVLEGHEVFENPLNSLEDIFGGIAETIWDAGKWITDRHNWGRIAFVGIGGVVLITALGVIAKPAVTNTIGDFKNGTTTAPPTGGTGT